RPEPGVKRSEPEIGKKAKELGAAFDGRGKRELAASRQGRRGAANTPCHGEKGGDALARLDDAFHEHHVRRRHRDPQREHPGACPPWRQRRCATRFCCTGVGGTARVHEEKQPKPPSPKRSSDGCAGDAQPSPGVKRKSAAPSRLPTAALLACAVR